MMSEAQKIALIAAAAFFATFGAVIVIFSSILFSCYALDLVGIYTCAGLR